MYVYLYKYLCDSCRLPNKALMFSVIIKRTLLAPKGLADANFHCCRWSS